MNTETTETGGARALLDAGAVLPADTTGAGDSAVELTARAYRHPALGDDRVVIRLAAAELGAAEDLAAGFLGLEPDGEPAVVGLGRRQALGFPEWVLVHHPEDGHHALAVVPELDRAARQAKTKPKAALDACLELAGRLAASVPHFLPVFHEQAARIFLAVENTTYAAQLFGKARASEAEFGLLVDEDRLDAVFLEFALAGALPVKVLTGYGKALALRVSPTEAFDRFRRLCVRRTAGGLPPSAQVAVELRRLARAAGLTGTEPEQDYLAELLPLPATLRAAAGWWKAHRPALLALARRVPSVRGTLLGLTPPSGGDAGAMAALWLELLVDSGATAGLSAADAPDEERCSDGTAGWLERFQTARYSGWGTPPALPNLLELVERSADRLRAELAAPERETGLRLGFEDVDLLDLVLSLDLPLADPDPENNRTLGLQAWGDHTARRELRALCADERFRPVMFRSLNELGSRATGRGAVRALALSPGSSALLADWVREVAASSTAAALPALPAAIRWLTWLPAEALALAPEDVARAAALDVGGILARTLRGGLFEELTWPAWETAVSELRPNAKARGGRRDRGLVVMDAWPRLIVANSTQVRVVDADSTVLTHDLRVPRGDHYRLGFHHVDGDLLVFWVSYGGAVEGYWLSAPNDVLTLDHPGSYWSIRNEQVTLPLPGGGRFTGHGVLHAGDTELPTERPVLSDGTSYWVWDSGSEPDAAGWHEYDPASGALGRRSQPAFLADALRGHPEGSSLPQHAGANWLRPTPTVEGSVFGAPVDGLLGWRVVHVPDRGWHGSDTAGRSVTAAGDRMPQGALSLPGDDRLRMLSSDWRTLTLSDHDGVVTSQVSSDHDNPAYSTAAVDLPPLPYWYCLRARDTEGSAALRTADAETCGALLKAAGAVADRDELPALVSAALPRITSPELIGGVVDKLRDALRQRAALDKVAAALNPTTAREPAPQVVRGPSDKLVAEALEGLVAGGHRRYGGDSDAAYRFLRELASVSADTDVREVPGRLHFDVPGLARTTLPWTELFLDGAAAVAYRAVVTGADDAQRAALCAMLEEVVALGLDSTEASAGRWLRVVVHLGRNHTTQPDGRERGKWHASVLPCGGGALLAITGEHGDSTDEGREFTALLHDPSGRLAVPQPYTARGNTPLGDRGRGAGWLAAFLAAAAERGAAPWFTEAAEEFARLTGVSGPAARLVLAGLPDIDTWDRNFLPAELRAAIGVKAADSAYARDDLRNLDVEVRRELVAALLPAEPARLWSEGPDVAAAAEVWNRRVGRRTPVPDWLLVEATRAVGAGSSHGHRWSVHQALPALLDPTVAPELNTDVAWEVRENQIAPREPAAAPFTSAVLTRAIALSGWLAHRLPAGDPVRAVLPPALTALRQRLSAPGLLLGIDVYHNPAEFRKAAGTPTETGEGYERYGAVVLPGTGTHWSYPALRPALLDSTGSDPYLPALRGTEQQPFAVETALRLARDPGFARLLADPGAPAAGSVDKDGTWWPQDAGRSVPDLVAEASALYGLGADAAVLYLALLAMPDPTDRNTARWTGWKPARLTAARAELGATDLVVTASRSRAGRSLFLPGGWADIPSPTLPVELWKLPMYATASGRNPVLGVLVPTEPAADLYRRAWERVREGDTPRFEELKVKRTTRRRR